MSSETFTQQLTRIEGERGARLDGLWQMTPSQRIAAMRNGQLSMEQCCAWAARFPQQVPLIGDEFEFIAADLPEVCE